MQYTINLVIGDWSNDGHGKTDTTTILSNFSSQQIQNAYELGTQKLGFNFIEEIAEAYEDNQLDANTIKKLESAGVITRAQFAEADWGEANPNDPDTDESVGIYVDEYRRIYLGIVKLGDDTFQYEIVVGANVNIGGYGLFN